MDRNSIIGLVLIFVILVSFAWWNQPSDEEIKQLKVKQDSTAMVNRREDSVLNVMATQQAKADSIKVVDTAAAKSAFGTFASFSTGQETFTTIENEEIKVTLTNKGG